MFGACGSSSPDPVASGGQGTSGSTTNASGSGSTAGSGNTSGSGGGTTAGAGGNPSTAGTTGTGSTSGTGGVATGGAAGASGSAAVGGSAGSAGSSGAPSSEPFSFFVTSVKAIVKLSGNANGFGGDLSYGETGAGAGLRGADKICKTIAETSMPGNGKTWRAFLSVTKDEQGQPVNAIDRVGAGPWYDRLGRVVAKTKADLAQKRPVGADTAIINDLPNEDGVPNHDPDGTGDVDNHDTLTGSNETGQLFNTDGAFTCNDWTSKESSGSPRVGHTWPRGGGGGGGMG
ncbi:MAG TPA: hypothetical protein VEQ58_01625, partial [Polyangiaceae bacterium]|nr:hypothetical protein [Polyangiaceae bacterium]